MIPVKASKVTAHLTQTVLIFSRSKPKNLHQNGSWHYRNLKIYLMRIKSSRNSSHNCLKRAMRERKEGQCIIHLDHLRDSPSQIFKLKSAKTKVSLQTTFYTRNFQIILRNWCWIRCRSCLTSRDRNRPKYNWNNLIKTMKNSISKKIRSNSARDSILSATCPKWLTLLLRHATDKWHKISK